MFQFPGFPTLTYVFSQRSMVLHHGGFTIRKSADRCLFTAPRGLSQLIASFFGSWCQGIHLTLFFAWTSYCCSFSLNCLSFTLNMVISSLREKALIAFFWMFPPRWQARLSYFGEIVVITLNIGKTLNIDWSRYLMSSISVRFNSFLFFYSIFNERKLARWASSEEWKVKSDRWKPLCGFLPFLLSLLPYLFSRQTPFGVGRSGWIRTIDLALIMRAL